MNLFTQAYISLHFRFALQMRPGGLVKIYDSALMSSSQYKSLLISERTTADELLAILLHCYDSREGVERFSLYEVNKSYYYFSTCDVSSKVTNFSLTALVSTLYTVMI